MVIAIGRQEQRDLVDAACTAAAEWRGRKAHRLTDSEFALLHRTVHHAQRHWHRVCGGVADLNCRLHRNTATTELVRGPFNGLYFMVHGGHVLDGAARAGISLVL